MLTDTLDVHGNVTNDEIDVDVEDMDVSTIEAQGNHCKAPSTPSAPFISAGPNPLPPPQRSIPIQRLPQYPLTQHCYLLKITGRQKGGFVKGWFWRMYPRSSFRSGGTSECALVPVFVLGNIRMYPLSGFRSGGHPPKPPFWKPLLCQPPIKDSDILMFETIT